MYPKATRSVVGAALALGLTLFGAAGQAQANEAPGNLFKSTCYKDAPLFWGADGCGAASKCAEALAVEQCYEAGFARCEKVHEAAVNSRATRPLSHVVIAWSMERGSCTMKVLVRGTTEPEERAEAASSDSPAFPFETE